MTEPPPVPGSCACGCGAPLAPLDPWGRPRIYLPGHNRKGAPRPSPSRVRVLDALQRGPATPADLAARLGLSVAAVRWQLTVLRAEGLAGPRSRGVWAPGAALERGSDPSGIHDRSRDPVPVPLPCQDKTVDTVETPPASSMV